MLVENIEKVGEGLLAEEIKIPLYASDIFNTFCETKYFNVVKSGNFGDPREIILDWIKENYKLSEENEYKILDYIAQRI